MGNISVDKLMNSFRKLELAISTAKSVVSQRDHAAQDVIQRLEKYQAILSKQRSLAIDLSASVATKDWSAAGRHLKIINALSTMIRDDASGLIKRYDSNCLLSVDIDPCTAN